MKRNGFAHTVFLFSVGLLIITACWLKMIHGEHPGAFHRPTPTPTIATSLSVTRIVLPTIVRPQNITPTQSLQCPSGTVRVCQAGECECQSSTTVNSPSSQCPQMIQEPCTNDKLPPKCGYSARAVPAGCQGCPIICY